MKPNAGVTLAFTCHPEAAAEGSGAAGSFPCREGAHFIFGKAHPTPDSSPAGSRMTCSCQTPIVIRVELFGRARILCGRAWVEVEVERRAEVAAITSALAASCPELVGEAIREDRMGLQESYTFNLNGTSFMCDGPTDLNAGDSVLLFSSQAGG